MSTAIDNWVDGDARTDRQEYFVSVCGPAANSEYTFRTIHKALSKARPGDIITIREGSYEEKVVLDKPVTIRRETSCARENVRVTGGIVIVGELLVEGEVGNNPDENALTQVQGITVLSGIEIRSGQHIRIRDCDICGGYDGIRVLSGKDCVIEHCQVHNTTEGGNGIYLASNTSQCIIQSCEIFDHRANGIELKGTKQISIKECHIYRSANGIFMREGCCHVLLNKNTIESSTYFGIHLSNSHGTITECNISNCLSHCVMLSPTSSVYCAGNHFLGTFRIHRDCTAYVAEGDISTQIQGRVDAEGQLQTNIETLALPNEVLFT